MGAAAVLSEYPPHIVDLVTDPRSGLPSRLNFPPSIKEIRDACNALVEQRKRIMDRSATIASQRAETEEYERYLERRKNNPTQAELEQQLGRSLGKHHPKAPPAQLWGAWCRHRIELPGIRLHAESRQILEAAGYDVDGPDDQEAK